MITKLSDNLLMSSLYTNCLITQLLTLSNSEYYTELSISTADRVGSTEITLLILVLVFAERSVHTSPKQTEEIRTELVNIPPYLVFLTLP
jgi:hypothetical protein